MLACEAWERSARKSRPSVPELPSVRPEERQEQYTDRIVPVEELEAPAFAGEFLRVGPRSPAEHGDNTENHGPGITVQNEHLWLLCNFPVDTTIRSSFYGFPPRRLHSASNSARAGKDFCVPTRVVESAA